MQSVRSYTYTIGAIFSLLFASLSIQAQVQPGQLVINEFMADNDNTVTDQDAEFDDWVEFYNNSSNTVNLNGLFLTDDFTNPTKWPFPDTTLAPNEYLIVWADNDTFQAGLHAFFRLSASGERLWLGYNNGFTVDSITFSAQGTDISVGRFPNGTGSFGPMNSTFAANNSPFLILDTIQSGELVLNEFMADNLNTQADQNGEYDDWIEIYNNTATDLSLQYLFLTDDLNDPTKWPFPDTSIAANDYLMVWADNDTFQSGLHAYFGLGATGDVIWLGYADGTVIDSISFNSQQLDISTGRFPNGTGPFQFMPPTFDATNSTFAPIDTIMSGELVLNEISAFNLSIQADQDGEFDDWIELYNNTAAPLSLEGVFLSDDASDLSKWPFPDTSIAANDYLIIWADADDQQAGLHASFNLSSTFGESLYLGYSDGSNIDQLSFGPQDADTTIGRFPNGTGPFGLMIPTFAAQNSGFINIDTIQAGQIVINELMADNTITITDQDLEYDDWIELYNNTANPISLSKVFLSDDPANLAKWPFPDTLIEANSYLIVWADQDNNQSGLHANFGLSSDGETLYLGYADGNAIDQVTYWPIGADTTFGRSPNGTGPFGYMTPTFSSSNSGLLTSVAGELGQIQLRIYPNPLSEERLLFIELDDKADFQVELLNPLGQTVAQNQFKRSAKLQWQLPQLSAGIYYLRIDGRQIEKIILE
ncbi:MAG: lamin tail domain-containing protein [Bacteroidia bacterium]